MSNTFSLQLMEKIFLTSDILVMKFEKPAGFEFIAGQFVQFAVPVDGKNVMRSYSISSAPDKNYLEFLVKLVPSGKASEMFARAKVGQWYAVTEPKGVFVCDGESLSDPAVFVATGAGIAPIAPMIEERLKQSTQPITLLFGVRREEDVFWKDRFEQLTTRYKNFKLLLALSQPSLSWKGSRGRVTEHVVATLLPSTRYYICGSVEMVRDVRALLLKNNVANREIHFEIY